LNAGARYEVKFTEHERGVRLMRGEALFTVTKDASRPFVVTAGAVTVRAVGTAFSVRHAPASVDVLVTEGRVAVERISAARPASREERATVPPALVDAGGFLSVPVAPSTPPSVARPAVHVSPAQIAQSLAWRQKRIEFTETPLGEVLRLFNQQNTLQLQVADAATGQLEVSGVFWSDDAETFVRLTETALNLHSERTRDRITLRRK
jgi:transmembrane sensor